MTIKVENLGKRFNREWIFRKLSYTFQQGHTYAITGPNGSGKSTLLQILWGQVPPTGGSIEYQSEQSKILLEDVFAHLTIATPYMNLIDEFTLSEMVNFHFKFKSPRNGKTIAQLFVLMELRWAEDKTISNFSSGMKQRLKLALAFYSNVSVVFLDEPTTNLDKKSTNWYLENLTALPKETLVIIASNQEHEYPQNAEKIDILDFK